MRTRYRVWLDGQALDEISDRILVIDVEEAAPDMQIDAAACASQVGSRLLACRRLRMQVRVLIEVHEADIARRSEIINRVAAWCQGKELTVNNRPGQRLLVRCTQQPSVSALQWTERLPLVFTAYEQPYWEDAVPTEARFAGQTGEVSLALPGTAETMLCVSIENTSGKLCSRLDIWHDQACLRFEGLALAPGERLLIEGNTPVDLKLQIEGEAGLRSVYHKRQPQSADALMLSPGVNRLTVTADTALKWTLRARGRYA